MKIPDGPDLVRRNLSRGYTHIIQCAGDLEDQEAIHQLRAMLANAQGNRIF